MINKYYKTKKYQNALFLRSLIPYSSHVCLTISNHLSGQSQFMSFALAQLLITSLLLPKASKFISKLYSHPYLVSRQHGMKRSEAFETGPWGSVYISFIYLLCILGQLLIYSETNCVVNSIWIIIAHRLVGITWMR